MDDVSRLLPDKKKYAFLDRSYTPAEAFENDVRAVCRHFDIKLAGVTNILDCERDHGVWNWLQSSYAKQQEIDELLADSIPGEVAKQTVVAYAHSAQPYVSQVLSSFANNQRVYYPHGVDQPRKQQVLLRALCQPKSYRALPVVIKAHPGCRWIAAQKLYYRLVRGRSYRYPLLGADYGYTFSEHSLPYPYERVPPEVLNEVLAELANIPTIKEQLDALELSDDLSNSSLILLIEVGQAQRPVNRNLVPAYKTLIRRVVAKTGAQRIYIKPHPRNNSHWVESLARELVDQCKDIEVSCLRAPGAYLPTELLLQRFRFGSMASIASCSNPDYLANRVPHYVARSAAELIDSGWYASYSVNYVLAQNVLVDERMATLIS